MKSAIVLLTILFSTSTFASESYSSNVPTGAKYINDKDGQSISLSCANNGCSLFDAIETSKDGHETLMATINAEDVNKLSAKLNLRIELDVKYLKKSKKWSITRGVAEGDISAHDSIILGGTMMLTGMVLDSAKMLPQQAYLAARLSRLDNDAKEVFSNLTNKELSKKEVKADGILYEEIKRVLTNSDPLYFFMD